MSRTLTAGMVSAVTAAKLSPILLADLDFSSGHVRVWSGYGTLTWNSVTWAGIGDFGGISAPEETTQVRATNLVFTLSGIPSALVATVLGEHYQGRSAKLYFAAISDAGVITADPILMFAGRMDTSSHSVDGTTSNISISAESHLVDLQRPSARRFTDQDQQELYPGDLFFQYAAQLVNKEFVFGNVVGPGDAGGTGIFNGNTGILR